MSKWADFYKNRLNERYTNHVNKKYAPFIEVLKAQNAKTIAEFGCGIGTITKILIDQKVGDIHHLLDNCRSMLAMAHQNLTGLEFEMYLHNILKPFDFVEKLDMIHSHGVLEHFSDQDIRQIISNQKDLAKVLVHYVPSHKYDKPSFGDERLLTVDEWKKICQPTEIIEFNNGYDLILIWKGN